MVIEPNGNNAMTSGSQTEPSMVPVDPRVLNLRTLREDSGLKKLFFGSRAFGKIRCKIFVGL